MSHIVQASTSILNPDLAVMRQALELVASQHAGGRVASSYLDFGMREQLPTTGLAVYTHVVHRGIGLSLDETGALIFVGDPWAVRNEYDALQQQIIQTYVSLATMQALTALGYTVQAEDGMEGQVILRGVSYA